MVNKTGRRQDLKSGMKIPKIKLVNKRQNLIYFIAILLEGLKLYKFFSVIKCTESGMKTGCEHSWLSRDSSELIYILFLDLIT